MAWLCAFLSLNTSGSPNERAAKPCLPEGLQKLASSSPAGRAATSERWRYQPASVLETSSRTVYSPSAGTGKPRARSSGATVASRPRKAR